MPQLDVVAQCEQCEQPQKPLKCNYRRGAATEGHTQVGGWVVRHTQLVSCFRSFDLLQAHLHIDKAAQPAHTACCATHANCCLEVSGEGLSCRRYADFGTAKPKELSTVFLWSIDLCAINFKRALCAESRLSAAAAQGPAGGLKPRGLRPIV